MDIEHVAAGPYWRGTFAAMASPCEVLCDTDDAAAARAACETARTEALRIEHAYSRYRADSTLSRINAAAGRPVGVDDETARLLDYADACHDLSGGRFDITSGGLSRLWRYDADRRVPSPEEVAARLVDTGWNKVQWHRPQLLLPAGMELDIGGIGKEYAVDRSAALCRSASDFAMLINYGGDMFITGPRRGGRPWIVAIEDPRAAGRTEGHAIELMEGGIATSGDARRFIERDGRRYGHIIDPRTGWPVEGAPRSVTVVANTCVEAGMLATLAMLQGPQADAFLAEAGAVHMCLW